MSVFNPALTPDEITAVCKELCDKAGRGRPDHPQLVRDVERAAFVAFNSVTFRMAIVRITRDKVISKVGEQRVLFEESKTTFKNPASEGA